METGRRDARAGLVSASPTATRLANVVRCPRIVPAKPVACADGDRIVARKTASGGALRTKPISRNAAPFYSRDVLSISIHDHGRTSTNRRLVETAEAWRISAECFARK